MIVRMRSLAAGLAGLLACLVLPAAVVATWTDRVVSDTDTYVDAVAPLASDQEVQDAVAERLEGVVLRGYPALSGQGNLVRQAAERAVESEQFEQVWRAANREAHRQALAILEDDSAVVDGGNITLDLGELITTILDGLALPGVTDGLIVPDVSFTLARSEDLERAQTAYSILDLLGSWLPAVWVVLAALALLLARGRRWAGLWLSAGSAAGLLVLWPVLAAARTAFQDQVPPADRALAGAVWDVLTRDLEVATVGLTVVSVVAIGVFTVTLLLPRRRTSVA